MYIPSMPLTPLMIFDDIDSYLTNLENLKPVSGGIGVYGPAAAYALVWELGNTRAKKPGPKTVWGTNRDNQVRIMSSQAPGGYVGVLEDEFWPIIEKHLAEVDFSGTNTQLSLEVAIDNASQEIAQLVRQWAPVDTGELRADIQGVNSDEASFLAQSSDIESQGTILL